MAQQTYQDAMLEALQQSAVELGTDTLVQKDWANTGTLIAGTPFQQFASLHYDFQKDYVRIWFNDARWGDAGMSYLVHLTDTAKANEMLAKWKDLIAEGQAK